jgi:hypothetical protein
MADIYAHLTEMETGARPTQLLSAEIPPELDLLNRKTGVSLETLGKFNDTIYVEMESAKTFLRL